MADLLIFAMVIGNGMHVGSKSDLRELWRSGEIKQIPRAG
jgi:hypothetical protein